MSAATISPLVTYYVQRLVYQYQLPKAEATIAILVKQLLADGLPFDLLEAFNLNTAVGAQLNTLGKYIGLPRNIGDAAALPFFGFVDYAGGGNTNGFTDYLGGVNVNGVFYQYDYQGMNATALSDTAFAFMIALKIALNSCDMTLASIQQILATILGGYVQVTDNQDMTLTYHVGPGIPVSATLLTTYLPKPMGVGINVIIESAIITGTGDNIVTGTGDTIVVGNL